MHTYAHVCHACRYTSLITESLHSAQSNVSAVYGQCKQNLGDQDVYTALHSLFGEALFHILPCTWNFQLCSARLHMQRFKQYYYKFAHDPSFAVKVMTACEMPFDV